MLLSFYLVLLISFKELAHAKHCIIDNGSFGEHYKTEMIGLRPVKAAAGDEENICAMEHIHCKLLITCNIEALCINLGEKIEGRAVFYKGNVGEF